MFGPWYATANSALKRTGRTLAVFNNLRAASRLAKRWRVVGIGLRAATQGLAYGPVVNRALWLR